MNTTNTDDSSNESSADNVQVDRCPGIASDGTQCNLTPGWGSDHPLLCHYHVDQRVAVTRTALVMGDTDVAESALVVRSDDRLHVHLDDEPRFRLRASEVANAGDVTVDSGATGGDGDGE